MSTYYPLLTLISIVLFGWLGHRLAGARNRNRLAWGIGGALLPPGLLVLFMLPTLDAAEIGDSDL